MAESNGLVGLIRHFHFRLTSDGQIHDNALDPMTALYRMVRPRAREDLCG